jgi:uncharacterized protein
MLGSVKEIKTSLIIVQPTPFCNIDCKYCYLPQRKDKTLIKLDRYKEIFHKLLRFPTVRDDITVVWHGGEPLAPGVAYYESAFSQIAQSCPDAIKLTHSFQTNGMLLNDDWCKLIRKWSVQIGLSVDGPGSIHDRYRVTRSGRGTHDSCVRAIKKLHAEGIPFSVISVLTREAIRAPDEMFFFYKEYDIRSVAFNIDEKEGAHQSSSLLDEFDPAEIIVFFRRFAELMESHNFQIRVREFEETLTSIMYHNGGPPVNTLVLPFGIITVGVNGDLFTFSPELAGFSTDSFPTFSIGNIFDHSFENLCESNSLRRLANEIREGIEICRASCDYFNLCGGGTPSNKLFENGSFKSSETMHCVLTKKKVTDFLLSVIESKQLLPGPRKDPAVAI